MLAAFYTTVAWDSNSVWNKLLPRSVTREMNRRAYPDVPRQFIHTVPIRELCRVLFARFGMDAFVQNDSPFSVPGIYRHFDSIVAKAVSSLPPSAVYAYDGGALQTFRTARRMGVKTIYELPTAHTRFKSEFFREEAELQPAFAGTFQKALVDSEWLSRKDQELELADQVIVPSSYVQSTLPASIPAGRVRVIPYGAPSVLAGGLLHRSKRGRKLRVLYVGTLSQGKGLSYLLEAIRKVETAVEFTIIGTRVGACKPLDTALQRYHWMPTIPHGAVLEAMSQHDVLAFPTLSEGLALVILEAMSRGMAVITTPNSGCLGIITDGKDGFIVPIRSSDALAEKLELLAGDRDLLEAMSAAALKRAQECTWQTYRELLASAMLDVLNPVGDFKRA